MEKEKYMSDWDTCIQSTETESEILGKYKEFQMARSLAVNGILGYMYGIRKSAKIT